MKRALLFSSPLLISLLIAGCPFGFEWDDECWDGYSCGDHGEPRHDDCWYDDCRGERPRDDGHDWPTGTACVPGAVRYCDTPTYCSWGEQRCNDRGDGWGPCYEGGAPPGCGGYIYDESCCIDSGSCCQDWFDYDGDGDTNDSVGNCEEVETCNDHADCPDGFCVTEGDGPGVCHDTSRCDEDEDCSGFGPGMGCDERGICAPEEAPCPSGECGCESDAECDDGMLCINSLCATSESVCLFDFECAEGSRCLDNECRATCDCDAGCPTGQACQSGMCVTAGVGSDGCVFNEDCGEVGFMCINATCFNTCDDDATCNAGETCRAGACRADLSPAHACSDSAECADGMFCQRGECRLPCAADINCSGDMSVCSDIGFCVNPAEISPQCTRASDCADGQVCLGNNCTTL